MKDCTRGGNITGGLWRRTTFAFRCSAFVKRNQTVLTRAQNEIAGWWFWKCYNSCKCRLSKNTLQSSISKPSNALLNANCTASYIWPEKDDVYRRQLGKRHDNISQAGNKMMYRRYLAVITWKSCFSVHSNYIIIQTNCTSLHINVQSWDEPTYFYQLLTLNLQLFRLFLTVMKLNFIECESLICRDTILNWKFVIINNHF